MEEAVPPGKRRGRGKLGLQRVRRVWVALDKLGRVSLQRVPCAIQPQRVRRPQVKDAAQRGRGLVRRTPIS